MGVALGAGESRPVAPRRKSLNAVASLLGRFRCSAHACAPGLPVLLASCRAAVSGHVLRREWCPRLVRAVAASALPGGAASRRVLPLRGFGAAPLTAGHDRATRHSRPLHPPSLRFASGRSARAPALTLRRSRLRGPSGCPLAPSLRSGGGRVVHGPGHSQRARQTEGTSNRNGHRNCKNKSRPHPPHLHGCAVPVQRRCDNRTPVRHWWHTISALGDRHSHCH